MTTKEEIIKQFGVTIFDGEEFVSLEDTLTAMQEYADRENKRIRTELTEAIELLKTAYPALIKYPDGTAYEHIQTFLRKHVPDFTWKRGAE